MSGSEDGTVCIWDGTSGEAVGEPLRGHEKEVSCVAVSGDGKRIVSRSGDGTVRILDAGGVSFTVTIMRECANIVQMGEVIRVETYEGYVN